MTKENLGDVLENQTQNYPCFATHIARYQKQCCILGGAVEICTRQDFLKLLLYWFCAGGILWHLYKFLQCIIVEFTSLSFSSIFPPPIPGIVSACPLFHFHTWVHNISTTLTFYTLSLYPPPSHWYQHPERTCFTFLFSIFGKNVFLLFKKAIQGVSL
jgi:hypothetical protein